MSTFKNCTGSVFNKNKPLLPKNKHPAKETHVFVFNLNHYYYCFEGVFTTYCTFTAYPQIYPVKPAN